MSAPDLFIAADSAPPPQSIDGWELKRADVTEPFDAMMTVARQKLNAPPEWEWCQIRAIGEARDALITGGVPVTGVPTRAQWRGVERQQVVVTDGERETARQAFEAQRGICADCGGCGVRECGVSVMHPGPTRFKYRACERCDGSGKPRMRNLA
jgi:hypothetical protein